MIFIDESGSITRSKLKKKRYFIISLIETNDPYGVRRIFRRAKKDYILKHQSVSKLDYTQEIKGSEMPLKMKKAIYEALIEYTDIKLHYIVVDNWHLIDKFHDDVELCFNYVLYVYLRKLLKKHRHDELSLRLDERNCSVGSTNSLNNYLKLNIYILENLVEKYDNCRYCVSEENDLIQVSDLLANTVFRACKAASNGLLNDGNQKLLTEINTDSNMYFPYRNNELSFFENDVFC